MSDAIVRTLFPAVRDPPASSGMGSGRAGGIGYRRSTSRFYRPMARRGLVLALAVSPGCGAWRLAVGGAVRCALARIARDRALGQSSPARAGRRPMSAADARALRLIARRTWRFFETFVTAPTTAAAGQLPGGPVPALAHRTSPTNLGLYLLSAASARDFGWLGNGEAVERLETTLATMARLDRFRGHFYNWYDTRRPAPARSALCLHGG